jgi:hypothetical protein
MTMAMVIRMLKFMSRHYAQRFRGNLLSVRVTLV